MEKEMLGIYISGHPLDKMRDTIKKNTNIDTKQMLEISEENSINEDGKQVKYLGIITSIKKKYTRNNTLMAFVTIEDLYGSCEIIIFDSTYTKAMNLLVIDNIVLVEGRLSIREDDEAKIVANNIRMFNIDDVEADSISARVACHATPTTTNIITRHYQPTRRRKIKIKRNDKIFLRRQK